MVTIQDLGHCIHPLTKSNACSSSGLSHLPDLKAKCNHAKSISRAAVKPGVVASSSDDDDEDKHNSVPRSGPKGKWQMCLYNVLLC